MSPRRGSGGLAFLNDRAAFVRRFVLAELLGPPKGMTVRFARRRAVPPAPDAAAAAKKPA